VTWGDLATATRGPGTGLAGLDPVSLEYIAALP